MDICTQPDGMEYAARLIQYKAQQLIGRYGFVKADRSDLEQELTAHVLKRLPRYDAHRSSRETFISRIIDRKVASMIRYQRAATRDYRRLRVPALAVEARDQRSPPAFAHAGDLQVDRRFVQSEHNASTEFIDVALDIAAVKDALDPISRRVCDQLPFASIAEISRRLQLPRAAVSAHVMNIRRRFIAAGIVNPN